MQEHNLPMNEWISFQTADDEIERIGEEWSDLFRARPNRRLLEAWILANIAHFVGDGQIRLEDHEYFDGSIMFKGAAWSVEATEIMEKGRRRKAEGGEARDINMDVSDIEERIDQAIAVKCQKMKKKLSISPGNFLTPDRIALAIYINIPFFDDVYARNRAMAHLISPAMSADCPFSAVFAICGPYIYFVGRDGELHCKDTELHR